MPIRPQRANIKPFLEDMRPYYSGGRTTIRGDAVSSFVGLKDNAGQDVDPSTDQRIQITDDSKVNADKSGNTIALSVTDSQIDHNSLSNYDSNEHIDHTTITITAGSGLTGGGNISSSRTINIGSGDGITVSANSIALTTPGTITAATPNSSSGNHTHATATSNNGTANPSTIAAFNASGQITAEDFFVPDGGAVGISGNELLTFNTAGNATFSGVTSVVVPDGAWVGAGADCSWVFDATNGDVTTQDKVGVGVVSPQASLHVIELGTAGTPSISSATAAVFQRSASATNANYVSIISGNAQIAGLNFGDADSETAGQIEYLHQEIPIAMRFNVEGNEIMRLIASGDVVIGDTTADRRFHVVDATTYQERVEYDGTHYTDLGTDSNGYYNMSPSGQQVRMDGDLMFVGAQAISTTTDGLTLSPADGISLDPSSGDVTATTAISADNFVSQTTGWQVAYNGNADFRNIYADELHVQAFIADVYSALAGGLIITQSRAEVTRDFTIPDTGNTSTLYVADHEGIPDTAVFSAGDYIRLRVIDRSGGGLVVSDVYGTVSGYSDLSGGEQSWTFTTTTTGYNSSDVIYTGSVALDYGQTGSGSQGVWEATVLDSAGSPYSQIKSWDTITDGEPDNFTAHVRLGNLDGLAGVGLEYGLFAGDGITDTDSYALITDTQAELHNIDLNVYNSGSTVFKIDASTPYYSLGTSAPTDFDTGVGVWAGLHSGSYKWRAGDPSGIRMQWDGTDLGIYDDSGTVRFQVNSSGAWLSNLALSETLSDSLFTSGSGLLLLGPYCEITTTSWASLRGQSATISGAFHQSAGRWPGTRALVVEEGTTNYCTNPRMYDGNSDNRADSFGRNSNLSGAPTESIISHPISERGWAQRIQYTGVAGDSNQVWFYRFGTASGEFSAGDDVTISFDYWGSADNGLDFFIQAFDASNNVIASVSLPDLVPTESVQRASLTYESLPANTDYVRFRFDAVDSCSTGDEFDVRFGAVQIEKSAYATSYCAGSLSHCSWSGTAHNSTSTRTATEVNLDDHAELLSGNTEFTTHIVFQVQYDYDANWPEATYNYIYDAYDSGSSNRTFFYYDPTDERFEVRPSSGTTFTGSTQSFSAGDWIVATITYDYTNDEYKLYINGAEDGSSTSSLSAQTLSELNVGARFNAAGQGGIAVSEFAIFDSALTAEEVAALYQRNAPLEDTGAIDKPGIYLYDAWLLATSSAGSRVAIDPSDGIQAYSEESGNPQTVQIDVDGDVFLGSDISSVATTTLSIFSNAQTYDGESMGAGDILMGPKGTDMFNMLWDVSTGDMKLRRDETDFFEVSGSGGTLKFGKDVSGVDTTAMVVFSASTTYNSEGVQGNAVLIGSNSSGYPNLLFNVDKFMIRDGTNDRFKVDADTGDVWIGQVASGKYNFYWDDSEGTVELRENTTPYLIADGGDQLLAFGANVNSVSTTAIVVFGADSTTYNSNSYDSGDLLLGDDSSGHANVFWDKSTGELNFRAGSTSQLRINTSGAIEAASSNRFQISDAGIKLARGDSAYNKISWTDNSFSTAYGEIYTELTGTTSQIVISADAPSGNLGGVFLYAEDGDGSSVQATLTVADGLIVGDNIGTTSGDIYCSGTVSTDGGTTTWDLGGYTSASITADGYVTVTIGGSTYRLLADAV
jgi:hypothetical protein